MVIPVICRHKLITDVGRLPARSWESRGRRTADGYPGSRQIINSQKGPGLPLVHAHPTSCAWPSAAFGLPCNGGWGTLAAMSDASPAVGRRVVVTGLAGSGKSTFSVTLAARTGLPVIHLDLCFWKPGWVAPSEAEWRERQRGVLADDAWIADGNYQETLDLRLERADTVVFLDLPWWLCAGRAFLRGFRMPAELPPGCDYPAWRRLRDEWCLAVRIWRARRSEPERERGIIERHGQHAALHVLRSRRAVREFLDGLDAGHAEAGDR